MKGQIYLVTAIFIVIMLVLLRAGFMDISSLDKNDLYYDFDNLKQEYTNVVQVSLLNSENITKNLDEFSVLAEDHYNQRNMVHNISYNVTQTTSNASVELYIYLGDDNSYISDNLVIDRSVYS